MPHYVAAEVEEIVVPCEAAVIEDFVVVGEAVAVSATMATRPVCGKIGHSALRCYKHFDVHYNGKEKHVNVASTWYNVDTEWYTDTGATDHITSELDKLTTREKYGGTDQVHAVNGSDMPIAHVGQYTIHAQN
jgi:hypothetical protein